MSAGQDQPIKNYFDGYERKCDTDTAEREACKKIPKSNESKTSGVFIEESIPDEVPDGLNIVIRENVFAFPEDLFQRLESEIVYLPEEQCRVRIKNQSYPIPRKIAAFGDPGLTYTFSGLTLNSQTWSPLLLDIKNSVESLIGVNFNFVLINRYADGSSCIGQHKDDEADLEQNYPICSLSFGETRTLVFKRHGYADQKIELKSNSLLVMNPPTNQLWSHGIPRQKKRTGVRINLTFRKMISVTPNYKRELADQSEGSNKRIKTNETKDGVFKENKIPKDMFHKKVKRDESNGSDIPENHFHLGENNYVTISGFADVVRIHIRLFQLHDTGCLSPTKRGISLTPAQWLALSEVMDSVHFPSDTKILSIIEDSLLLCSEIIDNQQCITFQRFYQKKDLTRNFVPTLCFLRANEWEELKRIRKEVTSSAVNVMFGQVFKRILQQEARNRTSSSIPIEDTSDVEIILTTSMIELLKECLNSNIAKIFKCTGCQMDLGNQLGHECITYNNELRASVYSDRALLHTDLNIFINDFVEKNIQMLNYISENFIQSLNMSNLIKGAIDLYIASDPDPLRMF